MNRDLSAAGETPVSLFQTTLQYCSEKQEISCLRRKNYLLSQNFKVCKTMNIVLMLWPWTHMNFVYMQRNDLGRYPVLIFW